MDRNEYLGAELTYLLDDQHRNSDSLDLMERNMILVSAAVFSFLLSRAPMDVGPYAIIALLPLLITLVGLVRFKGIRERMIHVDERIREIEAAAGVNGWWHNSFSHIDNSFASLLKSRRDFWLAMSFGNLGVFFMALLIRPG